MLFLSQNVSSVTTLVMRVSGNKICGLAIKCSFGFNKEFEHQISPSVVLNYSD